MSHQKLRILYATVTGTARLVAETLQLEAEARGLSARAEDLQHLDDEVLDPSGPPLLFVIATTGAGEPPLDAWPMLNGLAARPRYLKALPFGLIGLGDSSYGSTFAGGPLQVDAALTDMGAKRVADIFMLDAMVENEPEQAAREWFAAWLHSPELQFCLP